VTVPEHAEPGTYDLDLTVEYRSEGRRVTRALTLTAHVVEPPAAETAHLGDLDWISATNQLGPVERDTAVGFTEEGDGGPLTIEGTVYDKGLGTAAPSSVEYYLGGRCDAFSAVVGFDDSAREAASIEFEIRVDGAPIAESGELTADDPGRTLTADLSGAARLELVAVDLGGGEGGFRLAPADWADAQITCSA
jgi:alpha-galactosidase